MDITPTTTVAEIAAGNPGTIRIFQRHQIDFCCGGKRPLGEVCEEKRVPFAELRRELAEVDVPDREEPSLTAPLAVLIRRIVDGYHAGLREELPRLGAMIQKVLGAHGARHPELAPLAATFRSLREELEMHMVKEERILFPYVEKLEALDAGGEPLAASPFGSIAAPIGMMEHEHENAGRALARMRELTGGYTAPEDACNTFRGLYHGLAHLETELHAHIHLENNVVFPRAAQLERNLSVLVA
jgi:regulator of cell morphogenesis and NO signaling